MNSLPRRRSFDDMRHEMDRVLQSFFPANGNPATGNGTSLPEGTTGDDRSALWSPRVDVSETEDAYRVHMDLPGIASDDLEINYHDGTLSVSGERRMEQAEDGTNFSRLERAHGRFYRSFSLPQAADADKIDAASENGVLSLRIPKKPESKPRRIEVS